MMDYSVKLILSRTAGVTVQTLTMKKFTFVKDFKSRLQSEFFNDKPFTFGYIKRGHGMKGKQIEIESDATLAEMYDEYKGGRKQMQVNLWAKVAPKRKQSQGEVSGHGSEKQGDESTSKKAKSGNYQSHLNKLSEVEVIVEELEEIHGGSDEFTVEQLRVWAHMLHMKKHDSYDHPPKSHFSASLNQHRN